MADQNRIWARLSVARQEDQPELEHAGADARPAESDRRDMAEKTRSQLELELAEALRELRATKADLERSRARLEAAQASEGELADDAGAPRRFHRKGKQLRAEKRIAALEGELETERGLRNYFELALELLQQQLAQYANAERALRWGVGPDAPDAPQETDVAGQELPAMKPVEATPEPESQAPAEQSPDGWGVPLEAFPIEESEEGSAGVGTGSRNGQGRAGRSRLRHPLPRRGR